MPLIANGLFGRVKRVSRERASERRSREGLSPPRSRVLARLTSLTQIGEPTSFPGFSPTRPYGARERERDG